MKHSIILFVVLLCFSCVGSDTAFLPENIKEAKNQELLINTYKPSVQNVNINGREYFIGDCFTSFKSFRKNSPELNNHFFAFIMKLKNVKTGKEFEREFGLGLFDHINFNSEDGGIVDSNLSIIYYDIELRKKLDTIKVGFKNENKKEQIVLFLKQN